MPTSLLHQAERHRVKLKFLAPPDRLEDTLDSSSICLLTDDGSSLTISVAQSLIERGWKVVILSFPKSVIPRSGHWPDAIARVSLVDLSEEHLQQHLEAIARQYGSIRAFIHLNPIAVTAQTAKILLKQVFLIAKHLKKSLNAASQQGRSWFMTILHLDGQLGIGNKTEFQPIIGGFLGLTKTLSLEWERVFCRSLDFSSELETETIVSGLLAELYDPNQLLVEVGYSKEGRVTLVAEPDPVPIVVSTPTKSISADSVFLVSGGGRGITAKCVIQLAQFYPCKFILLGRSSLQPEPHWAKNCLTEDELKQQAIATLTQTEKPTPAKIQRLVKSILAQREIVQTLQAIEKTGGQAKYLNVDITNAFDLQTKLNPALDRLGKVTGIIHGAGVLADKLIESKSSADFEGVYSTKIEGLDNLLNCIDLGQVHHLLLFSSAAGFYGNVGQSDYAIANEILNKFAYQFKFKYPNCHVISFNWGPWDGGMVTPALKQIFTERQIEVIPLEAGVQRFVAEVAGDATSVQALIGKPFPVRPISLKPLLKTHRVYRKLTLEENLVFQEHSIGGFPVLPTVFASAWMANTAQQLYPGYRFFSLENYQVLKGIVFDRTLAKEYIVDLEEIGKIVDREIDLSVTIWSKTLTRKTLYHYRSQVKLLRHIPQPANYEKLDEALNSRSHQEFTNLLPYQDGTLFHGSSFQGVKRILSLTSQSLTMECQLPQVDETKFSQFPALAFHPIAADIQFQCMLIWVRHFYQAASLPLRCQRGEYFQEIPTEKPFYISMEVKYSSKTKLVADITSYDDRGRIYARIFGAEVTISKQLNQLFVPAQTKPA